MRFFVSTKDKMIPFTFHNESTVVHRLSPHFINITIASDIQTLPSTLLLLKEHLKCDVLYRKNPDCANGIGWEIVHINNSVSYDKLKPDEIFAITEGIWAYQHLTKTPVPSEDKLAFFHLISGKLTSTLSPQELHCLSILSIFDEFTTQGAAAVCIHTDIYALLKKLIHQEFILHHTKTPSTYALYPLIREFLHEKFSLLPKEEQSHYLTRAAQYFLSLQQYKSHVLCKPCRELFPLSSHIQQRSRLHTSFQFQNISYGFAGPYPLLCAQKTHAARALHTSGLIFYKGTQYLSENLQPYRLAAYRKRW